MRFAFIFAALHSFLALAVVFLDDVTVETARIVMVQTQLAVSLIFSLHGLASWTAFDIAIPGQSYLESSTHWVKNIGKSLNSFSSQHCPWRSNTHVGASFYPGALGWLTPSLPYLDDLPPEIILRISNFVATQDDGSSVLAWARSSKHMRQMLWPSSYLTISVTAYPDEGLVVQRLLANLRLLPRTKELPHHIFIELKKDPLTGADHALIPLCNALRDLIDLCASTVETLTIVSHYQAAPFLLNPKRTFRRLHTITFAGIPPSLVLHGAKPQTGVPALEKMHVILYYRQHSLLFPAELLKQLSKVKEIRLGGLTGDNAFTEAVNELEGVRSGLLAAKMSAPPAFTLEIDGDDFPWEMFETRLQEALDLLRSQNVVLPRITCVKSNAPTPTEIKRRWVAGISFI